MKGKIKTIIIAVLFYFSTSWASSFYLRNAWKQDVAAPVNKTVCKEINVCETFTPGYLRFSSHRVSFELTFLIDFMRSFISGQNFAMEEFEASADLVERKLDEISKLAWMITKKEIHDQLNMTIFMFKRMAGAIELMKHFTTTGSADSYFVHCIVDLNTRLLRLFDVYGNPERQDPNTIKMILQSKNIVSFWRQEFDRLSNVKYGVRQEFGKQEAWAMSLLGKLLSSD